MIVRRIFIAAGLLATITPAFAADVGRYQIVFSRSNAIVFLLDTATGRVWSPDRDNDRFIWRLTGKDDHEPTQPQSR
jgi:hypothetical protein